MKATEKIIIGLALSAGMLFSCRKEKDSDYFNNAAHAPSIASLINFNFFSDSLIADSNSTIAMQVMIQKAADSPHRYVTFHTSLGKFSNNDTVMTVFVNSYRAADINLFSALPGNATINAKIGTLSIDTVIRVFPALPEQMLLTVLDNKYLADSTDSIVVSAQLARPKGRVSSGSYVYFTTSRDTTNTADSLIIPDFVTSQNGTATAVIKNPFVTHGSFFITAWTKSQPGGTLKKSVKIVIK